MQFEGNWSVAHIKLSRALTVLMGRMLRHLLLSNRHCCCCCCFTQFEGNWSVAHIKLSISLTVLMKRMPHKQTCHFTAAAAPAAAASRSLMATGLLHTPSFLGHSLCC
jgi:hypothetical protein